MKNRLEDIKEAMKDELFSGQAWYAAVTRDDFKWLVEHSELLEQAVSDYVFNDELLRILLKSKVGPMAREFWIPVDQSYTGIYTKWDNSWMDPNDYIHVVETGFRPVEKDEK